MEAIKKPGGETRHELERQGKYTDYLRVGTDWFKIITCKEDTYLKRWNRSTISFDYGVEFLMKVPRFDDWRNCPDTIKRMEVVR